MKNDDSSTTKLRGYKAFDGNLTCRNFRYEVGKSYHHDGDIVVCSSGFHFCKKLVDCFNYYPFDENTRICEVEASGTILDGDEDKSVTSDIEIIRELTWEEVMASVNSGIRNSGSRNSGDWNSGNGNSGNCNSGDWNSGSRNSGSRNSGDGNSGNCNSGDWNSGSRNSGSRNSGDWNICNNSSGVLCSREQNILIFDEPSNMTLREWRNTKAAEIMSRIKFETTIWIDDSEMTDDEKKENPQFFVAGGYLKTVDSGYGFATWWEALTDREKDIIKAIPNFDAAKWNMITGIEV